MYMYMRKRAKYEIRRDEIRGRIFDAPNEKYSPTEKENFLLGIQSRIYGNVNVYALYVTTKEWIIGIYGESFLPDTYDDIWKCVLAKVLVIVLYIHFFNIRRVCRKSLVLQYNSRRQHWPLLYKDWKGYHYLIFIFLQGINICIDMMEDCVIYSR